MSSKSWQLDLIKHANHIIDVTWHLHVNSAAPSKDAINSSAKPEAFKDTSPLSIWESRSIAGPVGKSSPETTNVWAMREVATLHLRQKRRMPHPWRRERELSNDNTNNRLMNLVISLRRGGRKCEGLFCCIRFYDESVWDVSFIVVESGCKVMLHDHVLFLLGVFILLVHFLIASRRR